MCLRRVLVKLMETTHKQRHSFCSKCQKAEGKSDGLYKEKACCKQLNTEETIDKDKFYFLSPLFFFVTEVSEKLAFSSSPDSKTKVGLSFFLSFPTVGVRSL